MILARDKKYTIFLIFLGGHHIGVLDFYWGTILAFLIFLGGYHIGVLGIICGWAHLDFFGGYHIGVLDFFGGVPSWAHLVGHTVSVLILAAGGYHLIF